jgi:hypothetical protein
LWLLTDVINGVIEKQPDVLNTFLQQIESKLSDVSNEDDTATNLLQLEEDEDEDEDLFQILNEPIDHDLLRKIKLSLKEFKYSRDILRRIWKTIITVSNESAGLISKKLVVALHNFVTLQLIDSPLIDASSRLKKLLEQSCAITAETSIEIFNEFLFNTEIKPLFYRRLLHPGITEEQIEDFMLPISQLAEQLPSLELVVFFDEVNTSSCLGLFKEMFMDGTLHGINIPKNIFFTAAINPLVKTEDNAQVYRDDYLVHQLPQSLENLKVCYGSLESKTLADYIHRKIAMFQISSSTNDAKTMPLDNYVQYTLANSILIAQEFCEKHLGNLISFSLDYTLSTVSGNMPLAGLASITCERVEYLKELFNDLCLSSLSPNHFSNP